jgi:hypothetical protein
MWSSSGVYHKLQYVLIPKMPYAFLAKLFFPKIKVWKLEEAAIESLNYLVEHQPQKITTHHSMGSTRL